MRRRWRAALPLVAGLVLVGACSDDELPTSTPGACIKFEGDEVQGVDCDGDDVDFVVVDSFIPVAGGRSDCPEGTSDEDVRLQENGNDVPGALGGRVLCVVEPGELTAEHEDLIAELEAERG